MNLPSDSISKKSIIDFVKENTDWDLTMVLQFLLNREFCSQNNLPFSAEDKTFFAERIRKSNLINECDNYELSEYRSALDFNVSYHIRQSYPALSADWVYVDYGDEKSAEEVVDCVKHGVGPSDCELEDQWIQDDNSPEDFFLAEGEEVKPCLLINGLPKLKN